MPSGLPPVKKLATTKKCFWFGVPLQASESSSLEEKSSWKCRPRLSSYGSSFGKARATLHCRSSCLPLKEKLRFCSAARTSPLDLSCAQRKRPRGLQGSKHRRISCPAALGETQPTPLRLRMSTQYMTLVNNVRVCKWLIEAWKSESYLTLLPYARADPEGRQFWIRLPWP